MRNIPPLPSSSQHQKEEEEKKTKVAKTHMSQYENKRRINSAYHCYRK